MMSSKYPPPNYVKSESLIDGIEVYKPAPQEKEEHRPIVEFSCPQCGATTAYSASDGGLTCAHCGYYEAPAAKVIGRKAEKFEFTVETMERAAQGWGESRNQLVCQQCGARTSVPLETLTHTCAFCGSNKVIQHRAPQDVLRPRFLIPFKFAVEKCRTITHTWLGSSWMTPSNLRQMSSKTKFSGVYIPYWTFGAITNAAWKAEVGHEKRKRYWEDGEWKERVVIEWRWEDGAVSLKIEDLIVGGSSRLSPVLLEKINNFEMGALTEYEPKYLAGIQAQAYDISLEKAWMSGREQMRERTRSACLAQTSTSRVRNFSMNLDFSDETWRYILLPLYLSAFSYRDKNYQVMINGQTGAIAGQRPVDWTKVWLVIAAILSPGLLIGLIGILTVVIGGVGMLIGGFGFVLLIIGLVISFMILREAQAMDDA